MSQQSFKIDEVLQIKKNYEAVGKAGHFQCAIQRASACPPSVLPENDKTQKLFFSF